MTQTHTQIEQPAHAGDEMDRLTLDVEGMNCASCAISVERALRALAGVDSAVVNLSASSAVIEGRGLDASDLASAVAGVGYKATPVSDQRSTIEQYSEVEHRQHRAAKAWQRRALVGAAIWIPLELVRWLGPMVGISSETGVLLWITVVLTSAAQVYLGIAFYRSAFNALRHKTTNMDTLISIGASAAFGFSAVVLVLHFFGLAGDQPLYFTEATGLLTLISLGHWMEARTNAAAGSALRELLSLQPDTVTLLDSVDDPAGHDGPSADVQPGQLMLIRPGDRVAVDGTIVRGSSSLDESIVTGESIPVDRQEDEPVIAGSVNLSAPLVVEATTDGRSTTVTRIAELVSAAQSSKTQIQQLADTISAIFVPAVLSIAVVTFIAWIIFGGDTRWASAIATATTVLIISCPCALGLATPTAVMVASGAASKRGIIIKSAATLERGVGVRAVLFDKTGTLTRGKPVVTSSDDRTLRLAVALAHSSTHPLSRAIIEAAEAQEIDGPAATEVREQPGVGLEGMVDGRTIRMVSFQAAVDQGVIPDEEGAGDATTTSVVIADDELVGTIAFDDQPRDDAALLIRALHERHVRTVLITGDRQAVAQRIGTSLGIETGDIHAQLSPEQKVEFVAAEARQTIVAMIGDGINDAAALATAGAEGGLGIAMGSGANIAIESADAVIPAHRLAAITDLLDISAQALRTIKQNLAFSFVYNSLAIPIAAFGLLGMQGPLIAAGAMALSDFCVIGNSLRLKAKLGRQALP